MTPATSAAPAGWYRDPLGIPQLRWWNGISWTNHIHEDPAVQSGWRTEFGTNVHTSVA
ncbi:DUF2510 domain-containing protein [Homoserinibacter sp. GY 40078]|nr:DUF2510 domain-containing protein [Homoserinibacter sp. GY 40078]